MFKNKSLREIVTGKEKTLDKKITGQEAVEILNNIDRENIKKGIDYIDMRPSLGSFPPISGVGRTSPSGIGQYIKQKFSDSHGKYKAFHNKKQNSYEHRMKLYRNQDTDPEPLEIEFTTNSLITS
jgi:hypothetical protein